MKKLFIALSVALLALVLMASPAFAWGDTETEVDCSDISVDGSPAVGTTITFSGTVEIQSESSAQGFGSFTGAQSEAWYIIYALDGSIIAQGSQSLSDFNAGFLQSLSSASQVFDWQVDVWIGMPGDYLAQHGGSAEAYFLTMFPPSCGYDSSEGMIEKTVTVYGPLAATFVHPFLVLNLPDGSRHYFGCNGWGNPTAEDIVYSDGFWEVTIPANTVIQLDGSWHKCTWLEVDEQGDITGSYGTSGQNPATDIGLSKPITITKV